MIEALYLLLVSGDNGFSINPARDIGPRIWQVCIYGGEVFSAYNWYFWIPIVGPHVGAPIGAWIYKLFIGLHGEQASLDLSGDKRGYKVMVTDQNLIQQLVHTQPQQNSQERNTSVNPVA